MGAYLAAKSDEGTVVVKDGQEFMKGINNKAVGIWAAVVTAGTVAYAASTEKYPYATLTDGMRSIEVRVHKRDAGRFKEALAAFSGL